MTQTTWVLIIVGVSFFFVFFLAPLVWMQIIPCANDGHGYASFSYYLFRVGETNVQGHLNWMTQSFPNCR